ncbi:hypothetical protein BLA24_26620 [Streptomyces cinnamoneus]|uniref:Uncharacterized protein n=1 Tax=Streptomyces cinnamoneus TaxID=53446 RepID=A0A2G1XEX4_STRCJ|nr:hypothetical protein [Streptomyces cinnamoneus]PHQ49755.1 hypothetical protein BLA24_26620 [Streptomyces cinnamoneus]PPT16664.1 hypothetical protein CYQ11_19015 [Streptomyces cinnamoneus]
MASHARHARSAPNPPPRLQRTLARVGLTLSAGAALVAGGAAGASATPQAPRAELGRTDVGAALQGTGIAVEKSVQGISPVVKSFKAYPMAGTHVDPLDNGVRTKVADYPAVGTTAVTDTITKTGQISDLPLIGQMVKLLPGPLAPPSGD